ncbi:hypothetical protein [Streptomyces sp. NPDC052701]|uniref:hypothetical protein n=1 Tax=Streptomyces sp. NPDC052701 TaxID=3155533 RepID=UPI003418B461
MGKSGLRLASAGFLAFALSLQLHPPFASAVARTPTYEVKAASFCQCGEYVRRYYSLTGEMAPSAKDMGPVLKRNGFKYVGHGIVPSKGDVAIWAANTGIAGAHGHIAVAASATWDSPGYVVKFKGANQGGSSTHLNCNNVNVRGNMGYDKAYYYRK